MNRLLILVCSIALLMACQKEEQPEPVATDDYLVFGHFYGFCQGENCVEIFKLADTTLFEDQNDIYPWIDSTFYNGDFIELDAEKFALADGLLDFFPEELLDEEEKTIGLPDAGDWGGLYIEYKVGDTHQAWILDQMKDNVPNYLHDFIDECNERIRLINE